ncbi:hypothetical protein [Pedobacter sp. BMA]|uniref:hypothetical protein n=1 Tax=Pedobacter sp. BMA TaxID=1663685 RepID=UPI00064AE7CE|nr:hypothetical protein [Pedobacter sp. BMA]KLT63956.1 hypothetical protein AB669_19740 [Pedobacter sp. BMA]
MKKLHQIFAGLAGAVALNLLHEGLKKTGRDMPRIDLLGEEALNDILGTVGGHIKNEKQLYLATLAGDILSNTFYYSLIGAGGKKHIWLKAIFSGLSAGVGATELAKPLGLDETTVARSNKTKVLTIAYYLSGALVTAAVLKAFQKNKI